MRHSEHLYQILAPGLPDNPTLPATAEALTTAERIVVAEDAADAVLERPLPEAMAALLATIRGDDTTVTLTPGQARGIAQRRPADLSEYRLGRIAEWSQPRYRLDGTSWRSRCRWTRARTPRAGAGRPGRNAATT